MARRLKLAAALAVLAYFAGAAAVWGHRPSLAFLAADSSRPRSERA